MADIGSTHPKILQEIQHDLVELIGPSPEVDKAVGQFTFVQCTFLKSMYHLEQMRLRVQPSMFSNIFSYLEDKGLQKNSSVWLVLRSIVEKLLAEYVNFMKTLPPGEERTSHLEQLGCVLALKMVHIHEPVRGVASSSLDALTSSFPNLFASPPVVNCLLDLLQQCAHNISLLEIGQDLIRSPRLVQSIVHLESPQERTGALNQFASEIKNFLQRAKERNADEIRSVMMVSALNPSPCPTHMLMVDLQPPITSSHYSMFSCTPFHLSSWL